MIVFDSSPLIHLTRLGKLDYVFHLYEEIVISKAVYKEVIEVGIQKGESDAIIIQNYHKKGKIRVIPVHTEDPIIKDVLHQGEYESILLSKEKDAVLIVDDKKARFIAKQRKIQYNGTLAVLYKMLHKEIINKDHYLQNLQLYSEYSWISYSLYEKFRKLAD